MAEYGYVLAQGQNVEDNQNVLFDNIIPCDRGIILHNEGSGLFLIKPIMTVPCVRFVRFLVLFHGNVAIPEGGTVGPISLSLSINGEADQSTVATTTPAAAEDLYNLGFASYLTVPVGCCTQIAVKNISGTEILVNKPKLIIAQPR